MKQFTPLGNWLYRVRLKDGTSGVIDAARAYRDREQFRMSDSELRTLREADHDNSYELHSLKFRADGKPRARISAKALERIATIERWYEEQKPLSLEWNRFQARQSELYDLHGKAHEWFLRWKEIHDARTLLESNGLTVPARVEYRKSEYEEAHAGILFLQRRGNRPFLAFHTPDYPCGLFGVFIGPREVERIFLPVNRKLFRSLCGFDSRAQSSFLQARRKELAHLR